MLSPWLELPGAVDQIAAWSAASGLDLARLGTTAEAGTLECANHYIRAKRSFEAQYAREQARQRAASAP